MPNPRIFLTAILLCLSNYSFAKPDTLMVVAYIEEIATDEVTWKAINREDSLHKLKSDIIKIRMSGPFLLKIRIIKTFSDQVVNSHLVIRVWSHQAPEYIYRSDQPFFLILTQLDANDVYTSLRSYAVFKTWYAQWAKPFCEFKSEAFPEVKKPIFRNKLLQKSECKHYILIKDEIAVLKNRKSLNGTLPN